MPFLVTFDFSVTFETAEQSPDSWYVLNTTLSWPSRITLLQGLIHPPVLIYEVLISLKLSYLDLLLHTLHILPNHELIPEALALEFHPYITHWISHTMSHKQAKLKIESIFPSKSKLFFPLLLFSVPLLLCYGLSSPYDLKLANAIWLISKQTDETKYFPITFFFRPKLKLPLCYYIEPNINHLYFQIQRCLLNAKR